MPVEYVFAPVADIPPLRLYGILWLRVSVFVVEQAAAYPEIDGRDIEDGALLGWAEEAGAIVGTLRVLREDDAMRIGRVATSAAARGRGIGADLMARAVGVCVAERPSAPVLLDAQAHLAEWYARFGFAVCGEPFEEDGIPHLPMRREPEAAA